MEGFCRRMKALIYKEFLQLIRDSSSLLLGIVLPIILILIIGYGISLDVKNVPCAVVLEDASPKAQDAVSFLNGSDYFSPVYVTSMKEAEKQLLDRDVNVIIDIPPDFTSSLYEGRAKVEVIMDGVETATAMSTGSYVESSLSAWMAKEGLTGKGGISIVSRMWFNDANSSTWFFIPGLIMLIMTIVGVMLTSVVMAREWERGTFESLFVTPVKPMELVLAKMVPYFCVALLGMGICLVLSRFLFEVPLEGSLIALILISMVYLLVALGIGLVISAITKRQFLACQFSLLISFLPCLVLSGFIFDLRSTPQFVQAVGEVLPFSHYLISIRTLFLSGTDTGLLLKEGGLLMLYALFFVSAAFGMTRKKDDIRLFLQQLRVICVKEIMAIWNDPATRRIVVVPVIILGFLFGYAANYNLEDAPYVAVDESRSYDSSRLLSRFDGTRLFHRVATLQNPDEMGAIITRGDAVMAVFIPADFQRKLDGGEKADIQIITDGRNTMTASLSSAYAAHIVGQFNLERAGRESPVTIESRTWFNPNQITRWFFLPGIIGLLSFAQVFLLAGLSVAREREEGTFEQLLVAPVSPAVILVGKAVPPMIVGFIQCTILLCISYFWFNVPFAGSLVTFYTALFFYLLSSTGCGLIVSSISKNMQQVLVYVIVFMIPMALLSGIITPVRNMPPFLQFVTYVDPLRFALELIRRIYLEGLTFGELAWNFVPLAVISLVTLTIAGYLFRHHMN